VTPRRRAAWSERLTARLPAAIPVRHRPAALSLIRAAHTLIFASVAAAIAVVVWDGLRARPSGRTLAAGVLVLGESAVYASNNQVCPLTPLAEGLGAESGAVVDLYLPAWLARRIPVVATSAAVLGLVLNATALWRRRQVKGQSIAPLSG
jgi:hypothetical protein